MTDDAGQGSGQASPGAPAAVMQMLAVPMLYPNAYTWFVFVSSMDIMLTWMILYFGGSEVNPLAHAIIDRWDLPGAIGFKFGLMSFVILACEIVGRRRSRAGWLLAHTAVFVSSIPVVYSLGLLTFHFIVLGNDPAAAAEAAAAAATASP